MSFSVSNLKGLIWTVEGYLFSGNFLWAGDLKSFKKALFSLLDLVSKLKSDEIGLLGVWHFNDSMSIFFSDFTPMTLLLDRSLSLCSLKLLSGEPNDLLQKDLYGGVLLYNFILAMNLGVFEMTSLLWMFYWIFYIFISCFSMKFLEPSDSVNEFNLFGSTILCLVRKISIKAIASSMFAWLLSELKNSRERTDFMHFCSKIWTMFSMNSVYDSFTFLAGKFRVIF